MSRSNVGRILVVLTLCAIPLLIAAAKVGDPAPDFTATASNGKTVRLADYRGKFVVLEWHNNGCPYVGKHYNSGNMQRLQKQWTSQGVVWLTILSSAPGKQGYVTASEENDYLAKDAGRAYRRAARSHRHDRPSLRRQDFARKWW